ncbi:hypothetical protein SG09_63100 [Bradyrhizobium ottawaense]|nr:hypothetical protein SG09_63100 [Bradyrhizobium ottawaense]
MQAEPDRMRRSFSRRERKAMGASLSIPHPEERALARVSKDAGPAVASPFETPRKRGSSG